MKNQFNLPNYRIRKQSGPAHAQRFQVEVEINGQWYIGDDLYSTKRQAEQSAASKALEAIVQIDVNWVSEQSAAAHITSNDLDPPPPYSEVVKSNAIEHLPPEYSHIERYICIAVESFCGRVRKIWAPDSDGLYKFEIAGSYRYCGNVQRHHKRNSIYFMVDPMKETYYQMCHHSECFGFRSVKVRVNGRWYVCRDQCSSKKQAEQSAAANAWRNLAGRKSGPNPARQLLPITRVKRELIEHFPDEYNDIEHYISDKVGRLGGRIQSIWTSDVRGRYS